MFFEPSGLKRNGQDMEDVLIKKWEGIAARYQELTNQLMDPVVLNQPGMIHKLNKERTELEAPALQFVTYCEVKKQLDEVSAMLQDPLTGTDMKQLFAEESSHLKLQLQDLEGQAKDSLSPKDPAMRKMCFWKSGLERAATRPHCLLAISSACILSMRSETDCVWRWSTHPTPESGDIAK